MWAAIRQNLTEAVALAELPDGVRGYEDVKLGNVAAFCDGRRTDPSPEPGKIVGLGDGS